MLPPLATEPVVGPLGSPVSVNAPVLLTATVWLMDPPPGPLVRVSLSEHCPEPLSVQVMSLPMTLSVLLPLSAVPLMVTVAVPLETSPVE